MTSATSSTDRANEAHDTCVAICDILRDRGWHDAKISHFRIVNADGHLLSDTAVEVGYVYGECTVRLNRLEGNVDRGTYQTMRGIGADFVNEAKAAIKQLEKARA